MLVIQTVDAAGVRQVGPAEVEVDPLATGTRRGHEAEEVPEICDLYAGLLQGFAAGHVFGGFAGIDDAGHRLDLPGLALAEQCRQAHLTDHQHLVGQRVVRQHRHRMATVEDLALHRLRPAAGEETVTEAEAIHLEVAVVDPLLLLDVDIVGAEAAVEHRRCTSLLAARKLECRAGGWKWQGFDRSMSCRRSRPEIVEARTAAEPEQPPDPNSRLCRIGRHGSLAIDRLEERQSGCEARS